MTPSATSIFTFKTHKLNYISAMEVAKKSISLVVVSILGFLLFGMFSSLQTNDVTQYGTAVWLMDAWLIGYAILAILCFYNAFRPLPSRYFLALSILTFGMAVIRATQIDWSQPLFCFIAPEEFAKRNPAGNETGGLVIVTLWLVLMWFVNRKNERAAISG